MALELRRMRHVLALAEHGSFARASVALHLTQPALSRSIQVLEQHIGSPLFMRSAHGVVPTDIGRVLAQRARQVLQMVEDLEQEVQADRTLRSGQLSVGAGPFPVESVVTSALTRFIRAHPGITVRTQVRDWDELLPRLRSRELDFFVAEISTLKNESDLQVEPLSPHPVYFVGRDEHPLAGRKSVSAAETFAYPFIAPARIPPRLLEPMLQARREFAGGKPQPHAFPSMECNVVAAVKRIVENSDAVTALTLSSCAAELQQHRLTLLGATPWLSTLYGIVSLKGLPMSSAARRFGELVVEAEAEVAPAEEEVLARWKSRGGPSPPIPRDEASATSRGRSRRRASPPK